MDTAATAETSNAVTWLPVNTCHSDMYSVSTKCVSVLTRYFIHSLYHQIKWPLSRSGDSVDPVCSAKWAKLHWTHVQVHSIVAALDDVRIVSTFRSSSVRLRDAINCHIRSDPSLPFIFFHFVHNYYAVLLNRQPLYAGAFRIVSDILVIMVETFAKQTTLDLLISVQPIYNYYSPKNWIIIVSKK